MWLSLDPGKLTGWAIWEGEALLDAGIDDVEQMLARLSTIEFEKVVYEGFRVYAGKNLTGSLMEASQVIGAARLRAVQLGVYSYEQPAQVMVLAMMHSGVQRPKNHRDGHHVDAILHGYYHLEDLGQEPQLPRVLH